MNYELSDIFVIMEYIHHQKDLVFSDDLVFSAWLIHMCKQIYTLKYGEGTLDTPHIFILSNKTDSLVP